MTAFRIAVLAIVLTVAFPVGRIQAHPHVWVSALAFLGFEDGRLVEIRLQWAFDEFFSTVLYEDFDVNRNGRFEPDEIEAMRAGAFDGLGEVNFFTDLRIDGEQVAWNGARDFGVAVSEDGVVAYSFTLDVAAAPDPRRQALTLSLYDPDYYVSVEFIEDRPLRFRGNDEMTCRHTMEEAEDNPIYFDAVFPIRAVIACAGKGA